MDGIILKSVKEVGKREEKILEREYEFLEREYQYFIVSGPKEEENERMS